MPYVEEINCIDELDHYHLYWRSLLQQTRNASFFQSLDWLRAYWRNFGDNQELRVLVVYAGGEPIGILPLTIIREKTRLGTVRVLTYPLHDWASFYGPVGPNPTATLTAAMGHIKTGRRDWDLLDLRWVNKEFDRERTSLAMQMAGFASSEQVWKSTQMVDLSDGWDAYFATRSSKFRSNIRRYETRAAKEGQVCLERFRPAGTTHGDDDPRWDLFDECLELAERSWQGASKNGTTLSHAEVQPFLRDAHEAAARCGMLDVTALRLNGRMIAYSYNYHYEGRLIGLRTGYDPDYAKLGPGTLLLARNLQDSAERGDTEIDFGVHPADYKTKWRTHVQPSFRYTHYASASPRGQLLRLKHHFANQELAVE